MHIVDRPIGSQLLRLVAVLVAGCILVGAVALQTALESRRQVDEVARRAVPAVVRLGEASLNLQHSATDLHWASETGDDAERDRRLLEAGQVMAAADDALIDAHALVSGPGRRELDKLMESWDVWRTAVNASAAQISRPLNGLAGTRPVPTTRQPAWDAFVTANAGLESVIVLERRRAEHAQADMTATAGHAVILIAGALLLALVAAMAAARRQASAIAVPLTRLAASAEALAEGDLDARSEVRGRGEIGRLGEAFDHMGRRLKQVVESLEQAHLETIQALVKTIDARDPYTANHSMSVAVYARDLGRELGVDDETVERLHLTGLLHDIGKAVIDGELLRKPGRLTDLQLAEIRRHPLIGAEIVAAVPSLAPFLPGVRWHHERVDGCGYPDALPGDRIPLEARIVAVADTWNAITSNRPYRPRRSVEEGLAELRRSAGTQLAPDVVEAFERLLERRGTGYAEGRSAEFGVAGAEDERTLHAA